jgi:hypothetical protein
MGHDVDAAREALCTYRRPPLQRENKNITPEAGCSGPHSPGRLMLDVGEAPESGGYDNRPDMPRPDNAKGGHGAG